MSITVQVTNKGFDLWIAESSQTVNPSLGIWVGLIRPARGWLEDPTILKPSFAEKIKRMPRGMGCVLNKASTSNLIATLSYFP